jgi:hypothetical protein
LSEVLEKGAMLAVWVDIAQVSCDKGKDATDKNKFVGIFNSKNHPGSELFG